MSRWNVDALVALKGKLKLNVKMMQLIDMLQTPAGGFMSSVEAQSVRDKTGDVQQIEQVIDILLGKGNREFVIFCRMLRQSSYKVWAKALELEADKFKANVGTKHHLLSFCCFWGCSRLAYYVFIFAIGLRFMLLIRRLIFYYMVFGQNVYYWRVPTVLGTKLAMCVTKIEVCLLATVSLCH